MTTKTDRTVSLTPNTNMSSIYSYDQSGSNYTKVVYGTDDKTIANPVWSAGEIRDDGNGSFGDWRIHEGFVEIPINDSEIAPMSTILTVELQVYLSVMVETGGTFQLEVYEYNYGTLGGGDWRDPDELTALKDDDLYYYSKRVCAKNTADMTAAAWNTITATSSGENLRLALQGAIDRGDGYLRLVMATNKIRLASPLGTDKTMRLVQGYDATDTIRLKVTFNTPGNELGICM